MKGLQIPFNVSGGKIADTSDYNVIIEQKIINVLVTDKFERPTRPDYGASIQSLLFDALDELIEIDFKLDTSSELTESITGIEVLDITVEQSGTSEANVTVYYRTPLSPARSTTLILPLGLLNEESEL